MLAVGGVDSEGHLVFSSRHHLWGAQNHREKRGGSGFFLMRHGPCTPAGLWGSLGAARPLSCLQHSLS